MKRAAIVDVCSNATLIVKAQIADTFFSRLKGLLGRSDLIEDEGLIIEPCDCVHSFGMRFTIDVVFLDAKNVIIHVLEDFQPNKISPKIKGAKRVLELQVGTVSRLNLKKQQLLELR